MSRDSFVVRVCVLRLRRGAVAGGPGHAGGAPTHSGHCGTDRPLARPPSFAGASRPRQSSSRGPESEHAARTLLPGLVLCAVLHADECPGRSHLWPMGRELGVIRSRPSFHHASAPTSTQVGMRCIQILMFRKGVELVCPGAPNSSVPLPGRLIRWNINVHYRVACGQIDQMLFT